MGQASEGEGTDVAFTLHGQDAGEEWGAGEDMAILFVTWGSKSQNCIPEVEEGSKIPSTLCKEKWAPCPKGGLGSASSPHCRAPRTSTLWAKFPPPRKDFCLPAGAQQASEAPPVCAEN